MSAIKYLEAWNQTMSTKTEEPLASLLHDSFHMHSPRHGESTPKAEHLKWCVNEGPDSIGDFKVLYPEMDLRSKAKMQGYEGDPCGDCGNYTLVRNGTCMKCNTCGATSGCS